MKSSGEWLESSAIPRPLHGGNLAWASAVANCPPAAILDFSASINPLGLPASAIAAIQTHLPDLCAYPDPSYLQLRSGLGQFHGISLDWILPGNGSAELLTWACRELAELEAVVLPTPAFGDYYRALRAFQATIVPCPLHLTDEQVWVSSQPPVAPTQPMGLLLNNPHNPTGIVQSPAAILPLLDQFELVVVDEAFMDFLLPEHQHSLIAQVSQYPNLVVLRSLTKFYSLPGLRLGYAIAHPDRLQRWQHWRDPWSVNTLAAVVGEAVVQDTAFQHQTWDWLISAREQLFHGLATLPGLHPYPSGANFLLVRSDHSVINLQTQLLQQHQILIRDCLSFPELGDRFFRVAVRTPSENQRLLAGLADVLAQLNHRSD
ncbi:threonine-phosphate decarboxylase CobD [Pantanalinema rosaneae CENA516]|uniref:threonine-phosphate decarboxylase CobD n=1 Tax=Pantanalinema rosaneae TaxID=1620701 RepID=UPI003D6E33B7